MLSKREEIMQTAIKLFSEKGYFQTAVKEIADKCNISKGSLYQSFTSKEDLLLQTIEYNHKKMLQRAVNVNLDPTLSKKERLIQKIVAQFKGVHHQRDFMIMLLRALPPHQNPQIPQMMKRIKMNMTNWYRSCLLETYGEGIEPYSWDLTFMFQGVLKEYTTFALQDDMDIDFDHVARFVVEQFDCMIDHMAKVEPILTTGDMHEYLVLQTALEPESPEQELIHLFQELRGKIQCLSLPDDLLAERIAAVDTLEKECFAENPQSFMIKAIWLFLAADKELKANIERIKVILKVYLAKTSN